MSGYTLGFQGTVWEFPIGPDSLEISYTALTNAVPTFAGAYLDHFGSGIGTITLSAATGWGVGDRKGRPDGRAAIVSLKNLYQAYLNAASAASNPQSVSMTFADTIAGLSFEVAPDRSGLRLQQHKQSPLIRRFSLTLHVLRETSGGHVIATPYTPVRTNSITLSAGPALAQAQADSQALLSLATQPQAYTVQAGDSLTAIAGMFGTTIDAIVELNGIRNPDMIDAGQILTIS